MSIRYVLLMRHVAGYKPYHSNSGDEERSSDYPGLLRQGERHAGAVAMALREALDDRPQGSRITIGGTWSSPEPEPAATALILTRELAIGRPDPIEDLAPGSFPRGGGSRSAKVLTTLTDRIETLTCAHPANALLLVGHEPQMGWIANRLTGVRIPIDRGELICLCQVAGRPGWHLLWTIHPDDKQAVSDIREKIKSKMDTAKVMGGFITGLVTFVLTQFLQRPDVNTATLFLRVATVGLLLAAAALFFASLFHYDTLLMPSRFWGSRAPAAEKTHPTWLVSRPPSSSAWVLYQNMMRIWNRTFVPATVLVGLAVILLAQASLRPDSPRDWWVLPAAVVELALVMAWTRVNRPRLGTQD